MLNPFAPHVTEEIYQLLGNQDMIAHSSWVQYDESKCVENTVEIALQVNGKLKSKLMIPADADHFRVSVEVHVSPQFLSWIISLGDDVKIIGPEDVVERMREEIRRLSRQYGE